MAGLNYNTIRRRANRSQSILEFPDVLTALNLAANDAMRLKRELAGLRGELLLSLARAIESWGREKNPEIREAVQAALLTFGLAIDPDHTCPEEWVVVAFSTPRGAKSAGPT